MNLNHKYATLHLVRSIRKAGYTLAIWTVNDPARAQELLDWGCNAIVTDEIQTISPAYFI